MTWFVAKLGFVHRTLWQRDPAYRWAVLLGPPPLVGCGLAALVWAVLRFAGAGPAVPGVDAPWAHWNRPAAQEGQPFAELPSVGLPPTDASGRFVGFLPGWQAEIHPLSVDAAMEANVSGGTMAKFTLDQPTIPLARILDAGPPTGMFVGVAQTFFVVQTPGLYVFSLRLARAATQSATCLARLASARHRMITNVNLNTMGDAVLNYPATEFRLVPGLYAFQMAVGCWRGDHMVGPGEVFLMVRHPGQAALEPAAGAEMLRPAPRAAGGASIGPAQPLH